MSISSYKQEQKGASLDKDMDTETKQDESGGTDLPPSPKRLKLDEDSVEVDGGAMDSAPQADDKEIDIEMGSLLGLRILTKQQWRRLRNQYLNSQKRNISVAKRQLRQAGSGYQHKQHEASNLLQQQNASSVQQPPQNGSSSNQQQNSQPIAPKQETVKFDPGLIVKVSLKDQIGEVKAIKKLVRELEPNVSYVDVKIGQTDFHVRCKSSEDCDKFCSNQVDDWTISKLEGDQEAEYWKVIAKDMADKKSGKVSVPKKKKKTVLFKKLEEHKNSHMFFPE